MVASGNYVTYFMGNALLFLAAIVFLFNHFGFYLFVLVLGVFIIFPFVLTAWNSCSFNCGSTQTTAWAVVGSLIGVLSIIVYFDVYTYEGPDGQGAHEIGHVTHRIER